MRKLSARTAISRAILIVGLTTGFAGTTSSVSAKEQVNISFLSWPGFGFWFIAKEKNFAPNLDLNVQIIEDPYQSYNLMATGQMDVVSSSAEYAPIAAEAGHPIKLVGLMSTCHGSDNIILAPGVESAEDVRGKKFIALEGGLSQIYAGWWLEQNGVDPTDVEYVNLIMDDAASAMISGEAEAGEFWEPYGSVVLKGLDGARVASNCKEQFWLDSALLSDAMYMNDDFIDKSRGAAVEAMQAYFMGYQFWQENPEEAVQIIMDGLQFSKADVEAVIGPGAKREDSLLWVYNFMEAASFCGVAPGKAPFGQSNGQIYQVMSVVNDWWLRFGHMTKKVPPARVVDCSILRELYQVGFAGEPEPNY